MKHSIGFALLALALSSAPAASADEIWLAGDTGRTAPFCALAGLECFPAAFVLDVQIAPAGYSDFSGQFYAISSITGTFNDQTVVGDSGMLSSEAYFPGGGMLGPNASGVLKFTANGAPWEIGFGTFGPVLSVFARDKMTEQDTLVTWTHSLVEPQIVQHTAVPEPATLYLLLTGVLVLMGLLAYGFFS